MKKYILPGAIALSMFGSIAIAADNETRAGFGYDQTDISNLEVTTYGLYVDGIQNDWKYYGFAGTGDIAGVDFDKIDGKASWTGFGQKLKFGPALRYSGIDPVGAGYSDTGWGGLAVAGELGNVDLYGDILGEFDHMQDDWSLALEADWHPDDRWTVSGDYLYQELGTTISQDVKIGGRYNITNRMFGEAGVRWNEVNNIDGSGFYVSTGIKF